MILTDGTVVWIIDDVRDGTPVGAVRGSLYLPAGYVKANGATVQRADYPRLVSLADRHSLWTDDTAANAGLFGRGDGTATMVLPNWTDRMIQLAGDGTGAAVAEGLPNITGAIGPISETFLTAIDTEQSALYKSSSDPMSSTYSSSDTSKAGTLSLDASRSSPIYGRSNTVQPPAIKLIPIIRY